MRVLEFNTQHSIFQYPTFHIPIPNIPYSNTQHIIDIVVILCYNISEVFFMSKSKNKKGELFNTAIVQKRNVLNELRKKLYVFAGTSLF